MFTIERTGFFCRRYRLVAPAKLTDKEFREVASNLSQPVLRARKIGFVAGREAVREEAVVTRWNGQETTNTAKPGDWVVTNLSPDRKVLRDGSGNANTYVIKADRFPTLYDPATGSNEFGQLFKAKGHVEAVFLSGGFDIAAPWGQRQVSRAGYLVLNGDEVYGNHKETFETTYEVVKQ
jgi:hypothetical protein